MSKTTAALEAAVAELISVRGTANGPSTPRQRLATDRAFARILKLLAPRFRHFIRQYGLGNHWDDAEQCCAIAVHRAVDAYEPERAQFTTFVNWQIRGELQSLRFRLMTDQRPSAQKVQATTVSLHSLAAGPDGEESSLEALIEDEDALDRTERAASDYLARAAAQCLIEEFVKKGRHAALETLRRKQPKRELARQLKAGGRSGLDADAVQAIEAKLERDRAILEQRLVGELAEYDAPEGSDLSREQMRQMGKRAARAMAEMAETNPRFQVMTDYAPTIARRGARQAAASLLPEPRSADNRATRVVAVSDLAPEHAVPSTRVADGRRMAA